MSSLKTLIIILLAAVSIVPASAKPKDKSSDSYAMARGKEELEKQNYADALDWFNQELQTNPGNGEALLMISGIHFRNGEYGSSLSSVDNAIKKLPKKNKEELSTAYNLRAFINLALEDTVAALSDLTTAIKTNPDETENYSDRGNLYYQLRRYDLSDADYDRISDLNPGDTMGPMGRGRNSLRRGNLEHASEMFTKAIKLSPNYSSAFSFRAEAEIMQKKWNEASDDIIRALDIDQDDKAFYLLVDSIGSSPEATDIMLQKLAIMSAKQPKQAYWPFAAGAFLQNIERYPEAIEQFQRGFDIDANSVFCYRTARCLLDLDRAADAMAYIDRGQDMNPDDTDFVLLRGQTLRALMRYDDALTEYDRYVTLFPDDSQSYFQRGLMRMTAAGYADAAKDFATAALLQPDVDTMDFFLLRRADALRLAGKESDALPYYHRIVEIDTVPSTILACAYTGLSMPDKAIAELNRALATDTTTAARRSALYDAMCVYARLGRPEKAAEYLDSVAALGHTLRSSLLNDYDLHPLLRDNAEFREAVDRLFPAPSDATDKTEVTETTEPTDALNVVEVPFTREAGVTKVKCTINSLPLYFVFDTGASDVTLSMVEANFMLKNDFISPDDIIGSARYIDANGDISEGTVVNLRKVNFGGLELDNVRASVVRNQKAPLLLGQSVLGRLGKIEINNRDQKLTVTRRQAK